MIPRSLLPIANHLWQSTLFVGAAGLLTLALRKNSARVRHWVWTATSLKFLVPFSLLIAMGRSVHWRGASVPMQSNFSLVLDHVSQPFTAPTSSVSLLSTVPVHASMLPTILWLAWAGGFVGFACSWWIRWRRVRSAVRAGSPIELDLPIRAISSPSFLEPGVLGVLRPVLLLPDGIFEHLTLEQWKAVMAHELCHVRHRDNLTAMIQMFVEAVFWFNPLVWWVGKWMKQERERACDQEVLRLGSEPRTYARGILKVCELYLESPVACVAGVSGSNLRRRIEAIMANRAPVRLGSVRKTALVAIAAASVVMPLSLGLLDPTLVKAQSTFIVPSGRQRPAFEVASVKPVDTSTMRRDHEGRRLDGTLFVDRTELLPYIIAAYIHSDSCWFKVANGQDCPLIVGSLPAWLKKERWEIQATLPANTPSYAYDQFERGNALQVSLMLQVLLEDRFRLRTHRETREIPVYSLTFGKNGPKLSQSAHGAESRTGVDGRTIEIRGLSTALRTPTSDGRYEVKMNFRNSSMQNAADALAPYFDRPVLDRTGVKGEYDFEIRYEEDPTVPAPPGTVTPGLFSGLVGSELSAALQDVGLRLESTKVPVEVLVIDQVEKPSVN
jgi:uncharacterized protein (TIGR03435 family)